MEKLRNSSGRPASLATGQLNKRRSLRTPPAMNDATSVPADLAIVVARIRAVAGFPSPGILFRDIFPVLQDPVAFEALITHLLAHVLTLNRRIDVVAGIDARGFLLGPILALRLNAAFVPVRKRGKLPGDVARAAYSKEYGDDELEMTSDAFYAGKTAIVVDDLIATGGSARAAGELVKMLGGDVVEYLFAIELAELNGRAKLDGPVYAAIRYL